MADRDVIDTLIAEAYAEGPEGMRRVAETIINRAAVRGLTIDQVVRQPRQYTGYAHPGADARRAQQDPKARAAAEAALNLALQPGDPTGGADHYLNPKQANPAWASKIPSTGSYGNHQFFASRPIPPGEIANVVGSLTDTVPPSAVPPATISPNLAAIRDMTSPSGGDTALQQALGAYATRQANAVTPQIRRPTLPAMGTPDVASLYAGIFDAPVRPASASDLSRGKTPMATLTTGSRPPIGLVEPGNIDLNSRKVLHEPDGSIRTENSISIGTDRGEVLIPTVVNGKQLSEADAIAHYQQTGENLGRFKTPQAADRYAENLHERQGSTYDAAKRPTMPDMPRSRPTTVPSSVISQSVKVAQSARPTAPRISSVGDSLALAPVQGGRQTPPPFDAAFDTRTGTMRMLAQPEAVSSQGLGVGASAAPVSTLRPRPPTAAPDMISTSFQRVASANPTKLPAIAASTIGEAPTTRTVQSVPMPPVRPTIPQSYVGQEGRFPPAPSSAPVIRTAGLAGSVALPAGVRPIIPSTDIRPTAPLISASSNLASARDEQRLMRSIGTPVATRLAQVTPSAAGSIIENKPQDRLTPGIPNNSPANMGALVGYAAAPTPHPALSRPKAPTLPGTAAIQTASAAPVPAVRSSAVGTQLDVARPVMPDMPRPRPDLGMGGVDIIPVVPNATPVTPMPRLDRPGIFGKPQLFGRDIQLPGALGVIQDITKRMANASGPFNNGADNLIYDAMRGGDFNAPGAAVAQSGGYLYAPRPGGGYINVGRTNPALSGAALYDARTTRNEFADDAANRVNGRGGSGGGSRSAMS